MAEAFAGTPAALSGTNRTTSSPVTGIWGTGQNRTAGNLLVACVTAQATTSCAATAANAGTTGWTKLVEVGAGTKALAAIWTKPATGSDAAPAFTSTLSGTAVMTCVLYEISAASTSSPSDTSGTVGTTGSISAVSVTTSGNVSQAGEAAVGVMCHERSTAATRTITATGTGFTLDANDGSVSSVGHTGAISATNPASGAALTGGITVSGTVSSSADAGVLVVFALGTTAITGTDSGHGAEAFTVLVTGADTAKGQGAAYNFGGDWGHATEAGSVGQPSNPVSGADTAHGTEAGSVHATLSGTDSAHGTETGQRSGSPIGTDSGHAADASNIHATLAKADSGHGLEAASIRVSGADTGHGAEGTPAVKVSKTDSGHAAEASSLHVTLSGADSAHATQAGSTGKYITGQALAADGSTAWFTDQSGSPRLFVCDDTWNILWEGPNWNSGNYQNTYDTFLAARAAQGYTAIEVSAFSYPYAGLNPAGSMTTGQDWDGTWPFTSTNDPSSGFNNTFWARRDYFFSSAAARGITVVFNASTPLLADSTDMCTGWTSAQWTAYGTALGNRYKNTANILWIVGDDYFGTVDSGLSAWLTALRATGDAHLCTIQNQQETTSRYAYNPTHSHDPNSFDVNAQYNWVYTYNPPYNGVTYAQQSEPGASDVVQAQIPTVWGDGFYLNSSTGTGQTDVRLERQSIWWTLASGGCGFSVGDNNIWPWASGAAALVNTTANPQSAFCVQVVPAIAAAFTSLTGWHKLVSDFNSVLVTAGRGSRIADTTTGSNGYTANTDSYVAAARVPDGSLAVIYCAQAFSITIDQTKMQTGYTATWIDPLTGTKYAGTAGSAYHSGSADGTKPVLNSAGDPDWVLALAGPASTAVSGSDSGHGAEGAVVKVSRTDSVHAADLGQAPGGPAGTDSAHGTEAARIGVTRGDTAHGTDAGAAHASLSSADAARAVEQAFSHDGDHARAVEAGQVRAVAPPDSGHAAEVQPSRVTLSSAEAGHAAEAGSVPGGQHPVSSADHGLATESAFYYIAGADAGHGAEGPVPSVRVSSADVAKGAERPLNAWPSRADSGRAADRAASAWPAGDDTGRAGEAVRKFSFAGEDSAIGVEVLHEMGIWTYLPVNVRLLGKFWRVTAMGADGTEAVIFEGERLTGEMLETAERVSWSRGTRTVARVTAADSASAAERSRPVTGVTCWVQPAVAVAVSVVPVTEIR